MFASYRQPGLAGGFPVTILRADPRTAQIPVIALTANAMPRDIEKGLRQGFAHYLTKPIDIDEFTDAVYATLSRPGTPGTPARPAPEEAQ